MSDQKISLRAALTEWRKYWHTEYSDALTLTGAQADELCTLLDIPFDGVVREAAAYAAAAACAHPIPTEEKP